MKIFIGQFLEEVKIEYIEVEDDLLKVDFSEEMHTKHWGGAAGESMTVASIANTMTEFENIKSDAFSFLRRSYEYRAYGHRRTTDPYGGNGF